MFTMNCNFGKPLCSGYSNTLPEEQVCSLRALLDVDVFRISKNMPSIRSSFHSAYANYVFMGQWHRMAFGPRLNISITYSQVDFLKMKRDDLIPVLAANLFLSKM